jgi:Flp pilus assembly protein TadG
MRDERGLVGKAAITIMVLIVLFGLAAVDGGSIFFAKLQLADTADAAANAAEQSYASGHDLASARQAAITAAHEQDNGVRVAEVSVAPGGAVTVTVRKRASTVFVRHIGFLKKYAVVTASSTSSP